jgi:malate dehydrogenase
MSGHHNQANFEESKEFLTRQFLLSPVNVLITGALGQIAYSLIFLITRGEMFGSTRRVILHLLDVPGVPDCLNKLEALRMEIEDTCSNLIAGIITTTEYSEAFNDIDVALLIGARPRGPGMERKDLLLANASIFKGQGEALNIYAKKSVLVLIVGNPANTNALIVSTYAPTINKKQFACLTRLDQNRAQAMIATKISTLYTTSILPRNIHNVIIWGNHSSTQYPDARFAMVNAYPREQDTSSVKMLLSSCMSSTVSTSSNATTEIETGAGAGAVSLSSIPMFSDTTMSVTPSTAISSSSSSPIKSRTSWLGSDFIIAVQQRGKLVIDKRGLSSAASAASAIVDCMRDWWCGSKGQIVSMGLYTSSSSEIENSGFDTSLYKIQKDLFFSLPVICEGKGIITLVSDLTLDAFSVQKISETQEELLEEKRLVFG